MGVKPTETKIIKEETTMSKETKKEFVPFVLSTEILNEAKDYIDYEKLETGVKYKFKVTAVEIGAANQNNDPALIYRGTILNSKNKEQKVNKSEVLSTDEKTKFAITELLQVLNFVGADVEKVTTRDDMEKAINEFLIGKELTFIMKDKEIVKDGKKITITEKEFSFN